MGPLINFEVLRTLEDYIKKNEHTNLTVERVLREVSSPDVRGLLTEEFKNPTSKEQYDEALVERGRLIAEYKRYAQDNKVDAWIFPTSKTPSFPLGVDETVKHLGQEWAVILLVINNVDPASVAGLPGITMPCGRAKDSGVPFGIEIDTLTGNDERLIEVARSIEHHLA